MQTQKIKSFSITKKFQPLEEFGHLTQQVIMPIIAIADEEIIPLGTGFVINPDGLIMTAKHVIEEFAAQNPSRRDGSGSYKAFSLYALYISKDKHGEKNQFYNGGLWPIDKIWFNDRIDIALCWLKQATIDNKPFKLPAAVRLSFTTPRIDEHILGFGYYGSKVSITSEVSDGKKVVDYSQETAFTQGIVKNIFLEKRDTAVLKFPSFEIDAQFEPGMSGGPVFNENGFVCGVICSSMPLQESGEHLSYGSLLWPSLGIPLEIKLGKNTQIKKHTLYEIIKEKGVIIDHNLDRFNVSTEIDGKITVSMIKEKAKE